MKAIAGRRRANHLTAALAALLLVAAVVVADAGAARAVDTYSISGTVTLPADAPADYMKGVFISVTKVNDDFYSDSVKPSETDGTYTISGLPAGLYSVDFVNVPYWNGSASQIADLVNITYDASYNQGSYTPVDVTVGNATGIDAFLPWGSTLSGTVTLASDVPSYWLSGVVVVADGDNGAHITAKVDGTTGGYTLTSLPPGNYSVLFTNGVWIDGTSNGYTDIYSEFYDDQYLTENAVPVAVPAHGAVTGIDAQVSTFGHFNTTPVPTITHLSLKAGSTLGSSTGVWAPAPTFTYRWKRNGAPISGATNSQYKLTTADRGKKITLTVTGSKTRFTTVSKTSTAIYVPKVFTKTVTPTIIGTPKAGHTLTAIRGTWSPTATYSYRWYRSGVKITGATHKTYTLTSRDKGKVIKVTVTGKRTGYLTVTKTSAGKTIAK